MFDWKSVGGLVGSFAPMIGTALAGPVGGVVGGIIARELGVAATPEAVMDVIRKSPVAKGTLERLEVDRGTEWAEFSAEGEVLEMYRLEAEAARGMTGPLAAVGNFFRAAWRPAFGFTASMIVAGIGYAIFKAATSGDVLVLAGIGSLLASGAIFFGGVLGVLGVYVNGRTAEKKAGA